MDKNKWRNKIIQVTHAGKQTPIQTYKNIAINTSPPSIDVINQQSINQSINQHTRY